MPYAAKHHTRLKKVKRDDSNRPNAAARGYCSEQWKRLRILILNRDVVCQACGVLLTRSFHCDHIVPKREGGKDTMENLQALCGKCHRIKTVRGK